MLVAPVRKSPRALALLLVMIMLGAPLVALAPTASAAQTSSTSDGFIVEEYRVGTPTVISNGGTSTFVDNGTKLNIFLRIQKSNQLDGPFPVIVFDASAIDRNSTSADKKSRACVNVEWTDANGNDVRHKDVTGLSLWLPGTTADEPEDAFRDIVVLVNQESYDGVNVRKMIPGCTNVKEPMVAGLPTPDPNDTPTAQATYGVIVDYRLNLQVQNFQVCVDDTECAAAEDGLTTNTSHETVSTPKLTFKFEIHNVKPADDDARWLSASDYPTRPGDDPWKVGWRITYTRANATAGSGVVEGWASEDDTGGFGPLNERQTNPQNFPLYGAAGDYTFQLELDPQNEYPEFDESDNVNLTEVHVNAPDLTGAVGLTGQGTTPEDPFTFNENDEFDLEFNITVRNDGDAPADNDTIPFDIYLIRPDPDPEVERARLEDAPVFRTGQATTLTRAGEDGDAYVEEFPVTARRDGTSGVNPGANKLVLVIDPPATADGRGTAFETYESNNMAEFVFYVQDLEDPVLSNFTLETGEPFTEYVSEAASGSFTTRVGVPLVWRLNVDEDDSAATVELTLTNQTSGNTTTFNMTRLTPTGAPNRCGDPVVPPCRAETHELNMSAGILEAGNYLVQVTVTDSYGGTAVLPRNGFDLAVATWPIQTLPEDRILYRVTAGPAGAILDFGNGDEFPYAAPRPTFHFEVNDSDERGHWTGYPEQPSANKQISHAHCTEAQEPCDPANLTFNVLSTTLAHDARRTGCEGTTTEQIVGIPGEETEEQSCDYSFYTFGGDTSKVGTHYYRFMFTDLAGETRTIERWYRVVGPTPDFLDIKLPSTIELDGTGQWFTVDAHVKGEMPEDEDESSGFAVAAVKALFRHERSGHTFEVPLTLKGETEPPVYEGNWTGNVTVGWMHDIQHVGRYNVTLIAENANGGLSNNTTRLDILEPEEPAPHIRHGGSTPRVQQEVTLPVTFYANATDRDHWWAELVIKRGNEEVLRAPMVRDPADPWNVTYEWNDTGTPGAYSYTITARDSAAPTNNTDIFEGAITLVQNLPPRFEVESPAFIREDTGDRFGGPRPKIQVLITDKDGILANTIRLRVNGENVTLTESNLEEVQDPKGVRVTYTFPAGQDPFAHNETVTLNMTAQEANENDEHFGYLDTRDQSFRVDALPPQSAPPILEGPFWSALDTDAKNVSLDTVIRLTAEENADGAHTDVHSIRYRVLRTDASRWVTLTPGDAFTFQDLIDRGIIDYLGSSPYKITYYATDAVGNDEETHRSFDVVLDDLPPFMDGLASRLRGAEINSTWTDEHAGVNRVAAMARVNDGIYQPIALEYRAGVWSKVLDVGEKGDRVCYYLQAWDNVENVGTHGSPEDPAVCYEVGNAEPTLAITSPGSQAVVNGLVRVEWTALDPDGDDLTFKIYYRLSGRQNFVELASLPADTSSYALDSRTLADGTYDLQVTATDGTAVVFENVQVTIMNAAAVVEDPKVSRTSVRPGESVLLTALVNKADANVEARVFTAGSSTPVQNVTMHDDGQNGDEAPGDGVYSALVTFEDGGTYDVEIFVRYTENGQIKEATLSDAGQFTVKLTAADVFSTFAGLWVALVALAVACVGVGGYALFRRWRA